MKPLVDAHVTMVPPRLQAKTDAPMVWRPGLFEPGVLIELRMRRGVVAAVERLLIGLLLSVIGKRLTGHLASPQPASIGEGRQKNRVHRAAFLEQVEHLLGALVHEGNRAHLDAYSLLPRRLFRRGALCRQRQWRQGGQGSGPRTGANKLSAGDQCG